MLSVYRWLVDGEKGVLSKMSKAHDELIKLVGSVWPDVSLIFRRFAGEDFKWKVFLREFHKIGGYGFQTPFAMVLFGAEKVDSSWGLSNHSYRLPVHVLYCDEEIEEVSSDIILEKPFSSLRTCLVFNSFEHFQVIDVPKLDLYDEKSERMFFKKSGLSFMSGCLSFDLLVGECR